MEKLITLADIANALETVFEELEVSLDREHTRVELVRKVKDAVNSLEEISSALDAFAEGSKPANEEPKAEPGAPEVN